MLQRNSVLCGGVCVSEDLEGGGVRIGFAGLFLAVSQMGKCYLITFSETERGPPSDGARRLKQPNLPLSRIRI